jgi:hypothetical protein
MKTVRSVAALGAFAALSSLVPACSDESSDPAGSGKGAITFETWGEEYIEQEIPAVNASGETIVEDGFTIKYSRFLVAFAEITVADSAGKTAAKQAGTKVFDMHAAGVKDIVTFSDLNAQSWDKVSYVIAIPGADAELGTGATEGDRKTLVEAAASIHVEGTITKGAVSKAFDWSFSTETLLRDCKAEVAGKEQDGALVTNGGTDRVQLTIHGDHFFYDDLQSISAKVRAQAIVDADADGDGKVTLDELAAVKLSAAAQATGGTYSAGDVPNVNNLRDFVTSLSRTVGHFRGEGECFVGPRTK